MAELTTLDAAFHFIITRMVDTSEAPHYSELARHLSLSIDGGRDLIHDVASEGAIRLHPDAALIESAQPFSSLPTQYRITVDGQQKWFGQ
ncbi:MAG: hypothetical protein IIC99_06760 [Chloroflexi bacterium]|nr:hypothetical protein [Chloroflexota bacterium]